MQSPCCSPQQLPAHYPPKSGSGSEGTHSPLPTLCTSGPLLSSYLPRSPLPPSPSPFLVPLGSPLRCPFRREPSLSPGPPSSSDIQLSGRSSTSTLRYGCAWSLWRGLEGHASDTPRTGQDEGHIPEPEHVGLGPSHCPFQASVTTVPGVFQALLPAHTQALSLSRKRQGGWRGV